MLYHFAKDAEDMRDRLLFGLPMDLEGDQQILRSSDNYVLERRMNTPVSQILSICSDPG